MSDKRNSEPLDAHGAVMICPRCGGKLRHKRDGVFSWRYCPRTKACGWTVFNHDPEKDTIR
jgi:hypothetical protein